MNSYSFKKYFIQPCGSILRTKHQRDSYIQQCGNILRTARACSVSFLLGLVALAATNKYQDYYFVQRNRKKMRDWDYSWVWHECVPYLQYLLDHYKSINMKYKILITIVLVISRTSKHSKNPST